MFLTEAQAKSILSKYGFTIPEGQVIRDPETAEQVANKLGNVTLKVLIPAWGRGKKGGVKHTADPQQAREIAQQFLAGEFDGYSVQDVLVEEFITLEREYYLSITNSRSTRGPVAIISSKGGVDVEELVQDYSQSVVQESFAIRRGLPSYKARDMARRAGVERSQLRNVGQLLSQLAKLYQDYDAELVEINPLGVSKDGKLVALDCKMIIDDNSLYRHRDLASTSAEVLNERQLFAKERGFGYVEFNYFGEIACAATGAGLGLTAMDLINDIYPGIVAFFLDVGGRFVGSTGDVIKLSQMFPNIKAILVNRYGGFGRGQVIAESMIQGLLEAKPKVPVMLSLSGSGEKAAIEYFKEMEAKVLEAGITFEWTSHVATGTETSCSRRGDVDVIEYPVRRVVEWAGHEYKRCPPDWLPHRPDWEQTTRNLVTEAMKKRPEKEYRELSKDGIG